MPFNLGTVTWGGLDCPFSPGTIVQKVGFTTATVVPAALSFAKIDVSATALDQNGEKAVRVHLQKESTEVGRPREQLRGYKALAGHRILSEQESAAIDAEEIAFALPNFTAFVVDQRLAWVAVPPFNPKHPRRRL